MTNQDAQYLVSEMLKIPAGYPNAHVQAEIGGKWKPMYRFAPHEWDLAEDYRVAWVEPFTGQMLAIWGRVGKNGLGARPHVLILS